MSRLRLFLLLAFGVLAACGPDESGGSDSGQPAGTPAPLPAPLPADVAPGTYVHVGTGLQFPELAADCVRVTLNPYNEDGTDVGIGYGLLGSRGLVFTVYVYPRPTSGRRFANRFDKHFQLELAEVRKGRPDIKETARGTPGGTLAGKTVTGKSAEFEFDGGNEFGGMRVGSVISVFPLGSWLVKYRVTWPVAERTRALGAAESLLTALGLPPTGSPPQWGPVKR